MSLTSNDVLEKEFRVRIRGYDTEEVDLFLEEVAETLAAITRENNSLKDQLAACQAQLEKYKKGEDEFKQAVLSAHKLAEEMKAQASKESEVILERARLEADKIVTSAHKEAAILEDRIEGLQRLQREAVAKIRATIEGYLRILDEDMVITESKTPEPVDISLEKNSVEQPLNLHNSTEKEKKDEMKSDLEAEDFGLSLEDVLEESESADTKEKEGRHEAISKGPALD